MLGAKYGYGVICNGIKYDRAMELSCNVVIEVLNRIIQIMGYMQGLYNMFVCCVFLSTIQVEVL